MSFPFLTRSRTWPTEASTAYCRPRNFLRVLVLAGLSTMSRFLAIARVSETSGDADIISREPLGATRGQGGDSTTRLPFAARRKGAGGGSRRYKEGVFPGRQRSTDTHRRTRTTGTDRTTKVLGGAVLIVRAWSVLVRVRPPSRHPPHRPYTGPGSRFTHPPSSSSSSAASTRSIGDSRRTAISSARRVEPVGISARTWPAKPGGGSGSGPDGGRASWAA